MTPQNKKPAVLGPGWRVGVVPSVVFALRHEYTHTTGLPNRLTRFRDMAWWTVKIMLRRSIANARPELNTDRRWFG
jgi:hypothetical protein